MFELTDKELKIWRSQFVTYNEDKMGLRYAPFAFTEDGVHPNSAGYSVMEPPVKKGAKKALNSRTD